MIIMLMQQGLASLHGVLAGDVVVAVNGVDVTGLKHRGVIRLVQRAHSDVTLTLMSPVPF